MKTLLSENCRKKKVRPLNLSWKAAAAVVPRIRPKVEIKLIKKKKFFAGAGADYFFPEPIQI